MDKLQVTIQGNDFKRLQNIKSFAEKQVLVPSVAKVGLEESVAVTPARFTANPVTVWMAAGQVKLANGQAPSGLLPAPLRIWTLPDSLVNLGVPGRAIVPRMSLQVGSYDQATGKLLRRSVGYYSWGTKIGVQIKRTPPISGSPSSQWTYELIGVSEYEIVLLERLLSKISPMTDGIVDCLTLLYPPSAAGNTPQGLQSDDAGQIAFFLTQINLSTDTHPSSALTSVSNLQEADVPAGCYNRPYDFIRMLWEGSVTRSGGYFLYYYTSQTQQGLPDRIFNNKGEAELELLLTYRQEDVDRDRVIPYINCAVTGDISVTSREDDGTDGSETEPAASFSLYAEASPERISPSPQGRSLLELAFDYYGDVSGIAALNLTVPLTPGKPLTVANGLYQVGPNAPGGDLGAIAAYFGTTPDAIKAANPKLTHWDSLPLYTALRLPTLQVQTETADTLASLSLKYGEMPSALAAANRDTAGLFPDTTPLQIDTGPIVRSALVVPGAAELMAKRERPAAVPQNPDEPDFANDYLQSLFHMLGYQVADNQDFAESITGLPVGPADPVAEEELGDKMRVPAEDTDAPWSYSKAVPYYRFAKSGVGAPVGLPPDEDSPYRGIGGILQLDLAWQDIFGNRIITPLNAPASGSPLNRPPMLIVYTDALLGPGQWPSVSCSYQVPNDKNASLQMNFEFNTTPYEGDDSTGSPGWQKTAQGDLIQYTRIYYQMNPMNGKAAALFSWRTSLLTGDARPLDPANADRLLNWVNQLYAYLDLRADKQTAAAPPALTLTENLPLQELNNAQVFKLTASIIVQRPASFVDAASAEVRESVTPLPPLQDGGNGETLSLKTFAADLEAVLHEPGHFQLKVATGPDRLQVSQSPTSGPVWAVRLGMSPDQPIAYRILNNGSPTIFAPAPLANKLQSQNGIPVWEYTPKSGKTIDFQASADRTVNLSGIDLDTWGKQFLSAVDQVLSTEFSSALGILAKRTGTDYVRKLLDQKEALAEAIEQSVLHVFAADRPSDADKRAAREAFRQQLLIRLSNAYTTDAVIQFQATVNADVETIAGGTPGNLYGSLVASPGTQLPAGITLTVGKIGLVSADPKAPALLNVLLAGRGNKQDPAGTSVQPFVTITGAYLPTYIEHQIDKLPGIDHYLASSWLSFVLQPDPVNPAAWPLYGDLGVFDVPLILRAYPTPPSMVTQEQEQADSNLCQVTGPLAQALLWNFAFTYSEFYHFAQDRTYCTVLFNIRPNLFKAMAGERDLFTDLAEFVTVYPNVQQDMEQYLKPIDSTGGDPDAFNYADAAIRTFTEMVRRVTESWKVWPTDRQSRLNAGQAQGQMAYTFHLSEQAEKNGNLIVNLVETGKRPAGVSAPVVQIDGYFTTVSGTSPSFTYTFADSKKNPLPAGQGMGIAARKVVLPCLNAVVYQDAWVSAQMTRNEELVPGKRSADPFIYQTPEVKFANPFMPRLDSKEAINIAAAGGAPAMRSLANQLGQFFSVLFAGQIPPDQTIQLECRYAYQLANKLQAIILPVLLVPPTSLEIGSAFQVPEGWLPGKYDPAASFVCNLTSAVWQWFQDTVPSGAGGKLLIDLTIMSSLTQNLVPLVRLEGLFLDLARIQPTPPVAG
jgi:hypothetical protein